MTRQVDGRLLWKLVRTYGDRGTMAEAAKGLGVSKRLLEKLISGDYKSTVRPTTRQLICTGLNVSQNKLFPLLTQEKKQKS